MNARRDPPAFATVREGLPYVTALALAVAPLWRWRRPAGIAALALTGGCAAFFRDPVRRAPANPTVLYAPADGFVIGVDRVESRWHLDGPALRVAVFLSILDVHVNRSPTSGTVAAVRDLTGGFAPALDFRRSHGNRRREIGLSTAHGPVVVVQVAGLLARRVVGWVRPGDAVVVGQKLGMITFGSRTDLLIPIGAGESLVSRGHRVRAGQTPIARWL